MLRRIDVFVTVALEDLHKELEPHYSDIGRPSIDRELMIRLIIGHCYSIRSERRLAHESRAGAPRNQGNKKIRMPTSTKGRGEASLLESTSERAMTSVTTAQLLV